MVKYPFGVCLDPLIMCKEGWSVELGQEGVAWGWGELSEIPEKWGRETKILKRGGKLGQEVCALKRKGEGEGGEGGLETSYELWKEKCVVKLKRKYKLNQENITTVKETVKQRMQLKAQRIRKCEKRGNSIKRLEKKK